MSVFEASKRLIAYKISALARPKTNHQANSRQRKRKRFLKQVLKRCVENARQSRVYDRCTRRIDKILRTIDRM